MAGTIPLSMTQQFDVYGQPLAGGQLFLIQAGTVSTPQNGYQDTGLTIALPNPITLDAAGRVPQFFLADGSIKVRLQDKTGVVQLAADNILVIGPSAGGGGGATVDPTTLIQTGDILARYGIGIHTGFVRLNALTIGSATSGASERANADCQALFLYLWGVDTNLAVIGGRGASAAADWAANKQLTLPDWRGYALGALDTMGGAAAGRLTATYFGSNAAVLGAIGGSEFTVQTLAQMVAHNHVATSTVTDPGHFHDLSATQFQASPGSGIIAPNLGLYNPGQAVTILKPTGISVATALANSGGGQGMRTIGPTKLCTFYMKL
jgi:hypothetical protein